MKQPEALDTQELVDDAWRILRELISTGKARLRNGDEIGADSPLVGLIERTARLSKPQERRMAQVEDFRVKRSA